MPPLRKSKWCYAHHPKKARERAAARRLGGAHRKRTGGDPPDDVSLTTAGDIRTLLERVAVDAFALDNSAQRARALVGVATVALKGLEVGALEERIEALENYVHSMGTT
jgi:hypothetical protein